jgi:hypothetical protein
MTGRRIDDSMGDVQGDLWLRVRIEGRVVTLLLYKPDEAGHDEPSEREWSMGKVNDSVDQDRYKTRSSSTLDVSFSN